MKKDPENALPPGWAWISIDHLIGKEGLFVDGDWVESKDQDPSGSVRLIQLADIGEYCFKDQSDRYLTHEKAKELDCTFLKKGDVLISRLPDPLGRACLFPLEGEESFVTAVDVSIVRLDKSVHPKWFIYVFNSPSVRSQINKYKTGTTRGRISRKNLKKINIPLPPFPEQQRIAAKIEELFSELDDSVANLETARARLQTYRQSLLKHAFEGRLTEQWRRDHADDLESAEELLERIREERQARYQQQLEDWKAQVAQWEADGKPGKKPRKPSKPKEFGPETPEEIDSLWDLPKGWVWARIGNVGKVETGVTPLKKRRDFYEGGAVPWVTSGALNDSFVTEPSGHITETALRETNLKIFPAHTLLVAMYGEGKTRGKASELLFDSTTNQAVAAIVQEGIEESLRPYLKWFLVWNYDRIREASSGGVQPNLNLSIVANTLFPVPPLMEQEEVVKILEAGFSYVEETDKAIDYAINKTATLRQSILKRAFEGRLAPQHPNDEQAALFLEGVGS